MAHSLMAGIGTLLAGLFGFAMQSLISHSLRPADYAGAFSVLTFVTMLTLPAGAFSRLITWSTSRDLVNQSQASLALLRTTTVRLVAAGGIVGLACLLASVPISTFLQVPVAYVLAGATAIPCQMATPALLGRLQGQQRFGSWSIINVGLAATKLIGAVVLGVPLGTLGVLLGISLATVVTFACAVVLVWERSGPETPAADWSGAFGFVSLMVVSSGALTLLMTSDVVLVKHLFHAHLAGEYSAVAAVGRSIFWAMGALASVVFPKVAFRHANGNSTVALVAAAVGLAVVGGLVCTVPFAVSGRLILTVFAGRLYGAGAAYLGWYALGMALMAADSVLVNAQQSLVSGAVLWALVPITLLKPLAILVFHPGLLAVVLVSDLSFALLLIALVALFVVEERRRSQSRMASA